jgi:hypothetical protein
MPEGTRSANPQVGNGAGQGTGGSSPQVGNGDPTVNPQVGNSGSGNPQQPQMSLDEAMDALRKERLALADARTKLKKLDEFEKAQADAEAAKLTEIDRAGKERDTFKTQAETYRAKLAAMAVQIEAQRLGIVDPEVAATLIAAKLELDADGTPTNAADLLKELVKAKPYLAAGAPQRPSAGGATNPSRQASAPAGGANGALSWDVITQLAQQDPDEYNRRRTEIQNWMVRHPLRR